MRTIAIVAGGDSSEYEISVKSAAEVSKMISSRNKTYIIIINNVNWYWEDPKGRYHSTTRTISLRMWMTILSVLMRFSSLYMANPERMVSYRVILI
jgi:D-alanine-D-alanine ligase-like ATP-grasp enzyme